MNMNLSSPKYCVLVSVALGLLLAASIAVLFGMNEVITRWNGAIMAAFMSAFGWITVSRKMYYFPLSIIFSLTTYGLCGCVFQQISRG